MKRGNRHLGKITGQHSCPQFHLSLLGSLTSYGRGGTWRRKWERLKIVGGQGSHNKSIGCGASWAYDQGPDDEEEEHICKRKLVNQFHISSSSTQYQHSQNVVFLRYITLKNNSCSVISQLMKQHN